MFIDIHAHTMRLPAYPRNGKAAYASPDQLLGTYDRIGVERAVLLPEVNPECSHGVQSNEEILEIAGRNSRFIPFCNIDPRAVGNSDTAPLAKMVKYYKDLGCMGIGEVCANLPFLDPLVQNLFRAADENEMPLTFHISSSIGGDYGLYDNPGLPQLEECLKRFPKLKLFGHSQAFWAEISVLNQKSDRNGYPGYGILEEGAVQKLMRKHPNLYGDLSAGSGCNALKRDRRYAIKFLNEFQDRLMFGTDICSPDTPTPLADFLLDLENSGDISKTVFDKVAKGNAIKILGLK
jgi:predicted TIM-barrel fold metal-dependent hydrolase